MAIAAVIIACIFVIWRPEEGWRTAEAVWP
jgi:hypothetical protein